MRDRLPLTAGLLAWVLSLTPAQAQDARTVVAEATKAMGAANLTSIMLAGSAAQGNFGQSRTITFGLASTNIRNYRHDDRLRHHGAARDRQRRARADPPAAAVRPHRPVPTSRRSRPARRGSSSFRSG